MKIYLNVSDSWPAQRVDIGRVGENGFRTVEIDAEKWSRDWPGCAYALIYRRPDGLVYPVAVEVSGSVINWTVGAADVAVEGIGALELRLLSGGAIGKSAVIPCVVGASITANSGTPPEMSPDWLAQTSAASATAMTKAAEALISAQSAAADAASAGEDAGTAGAAAQTAACKAAESVSAAAQAVTAATQSVQALTDLLAMLENDIAKLVGGKIPLSQIPATATQEIYAVASESELTGLDAQRGDLAELIEEIGGERTITKTWQCLGEASVLANWVVWGTSYAVRAGSATLTENAANAEHINGKRMVAMTQTQYDNAALDGDTFYVVTPDEV